MELIILLVLSLSQHFLGFCLDVVAHDVPLVVLCIVLTLLFHVQSHNFLANSHRVLKVLYKPICEQTEVVSFALSNSSFILLSGVDCLHIFEHGLDLASERIDVLPPVFNPVSGFSILLVEPASISSGV